jgi:hypothetical protein
MSLKHRLERWVFNRDLSVAKKRFEKIRKSSIYNKAPTLKRRGIVKEILRAAGFKKIRIKERD